MVYEKTKELYRFAAGRKPAISAIIPARGGSKGLPGKNIYPLNGRPLIEYSIESAKGCKDIDKDIVSTDDPEIKRISLNCGAEVLDRPAHLAGDMALSSDVVRHVLEILEKESSLPDYFILLQPTSPLRTGEHIGACINLFLHSGCSSCISVTEAEHHPFKMLIVEGDRLRPLFGAENLHRPRQALPPVYRQNGAIYLTSSKLFLQTVTFFNEPVLPFMMAKEDSVDIDSIFDVKEAEMYLEIRKNRE